MGDERDEGVYDIGYGGYGNPCRYLQQVLNGFLRCLGLERSGGNGDGGDSGEEEDGGGGDEGSGGGDGGDGGGDMDDPPTDDPPTVDPIDAPASGTGFGRRPSPRRGPISSGGPGQTN